MADNIIRAKLIGDNDGKNHGYIMANSTVGNIFR